MKVLFGIMMTSLFALTASAQSGVSLGRLSFGGSACQTQYSKPTLRGGVLRVPLTTQVSKSSGTRLERGTCAFTLPVQVAPGYRLVLNDLSALGSVNLSKGTTSRADLEVFAAGDHGEVLTSVEGSQTKNVRKRIQLKQDGEVLVSACGASLNLRGNSSILLQGDARASANLQFVELAVEVERCH